MAVQFDHLYEILLSFEYLHKAFKKVAKGKRSNAAVASFEWNLESNLLCLLEELKTGSYRHGKYHSFYIRDPKLRLISAAPFRDRVVHHALCMILEPLFERTFIGDSYANRKGKGTHLAIQKTQKYSKSYQYVLQCDVKEFFPSISGSHRSSVGTHTGVMHSHAGAMGTR